MRLIPLQTHVMVADVLTKSLPGPALPCTVRLCWAILLFSLISPVSQFFNASLLLQHP